LTSNLSAHELVVKCGLSAHTDLPLARQTQLLGISRSSVYYQPVPTDPATLTLQNRVDELYTECPYLGSRSLQAIINREREQTGESPIGRRKIQSIMDILGIAAIYPGPNLSKNGKEHPKYPYLLNGVTILSPNQVWGTDITYIRMHQGFVYLTAILDWYSRYIVSWQISTSLEVSFCVEAARQALQVGVPQIMNSDQGVQYTSQDWLTLWESTPAKISMDGRRRFVDNIFVERLWRTIKYQEVYLKDYQTVQEAIEGIGKYIDKYNNWRPHQSLDYQTPAEIYFGKPLKN
jgi:putative transposase